MDEIVEQKLRLGRRIRDLRTEAGWTQTQLAQALGISFQQVQKYEHGITRVSVVTILRVLSVLGVPADIFFAGMADPTGLPFTHAVTDPSSEQLRRDYQAIKNPEARRALRDMARVLAGGAVAKRSL
ncbi:MAG: helix-turn-helix domain-containing protein [Brevundimonas sp.]|nr:MAG: helix-turn-helix domain-containing protein [Brevundimonas sp.]